MEFVILRSRWICKTPDEMNETGSTGQPGFTTTIRSFTLRRSVPCIDKL